MKNLLSTFAACAALVIPALADDAKDEKGFVSIFDGKTLEGWKVGDKQDAFKVEDGAIVANAACAHLFYMGKEHGAKWENYEVRLDVMTKPNSNGGFFISSVYQESGWPSHGYEVQVNNTQSDPQKSGGLYNTVKNLEPFKDGEWMKYDITVNKGVINISVNGKQLVKDYKPEEGKSKLEKGGGTFAIQAHDPGSTTYYKNIRVKPLD